MISGTELSFQLVVPPVVFLLWHVRMSTGRGTWWSSSNQDFSMQNVFTEQHNMYDPQRGGAWLNNKREPPGDGRIQTDLAFISITDLGVKRGNKGSRTDTGLSSCCWRSNLSHRFGDCATRIQLASIETKETTITLHHPETRAVSGKRRAPTLALAREWEL